MADGCLKRKLRRQLNSARPASTEEWIANANVAGGAQSKAAVANFLAIRNMESAADRRVAQGIGSSGCRVRDEKRQERAGKVWMIQDVKKLRPKLHVQPLRKGCILVQSEIPVLEGGANQRIPALVAEVASARNAIRSSTSGTCDS